MDKLRVKQYRSWNDTGKVLRQLINEKHFFIDADERSQLQKCLDLIQKNIKINSAQGMIERLDTITRQLGLKLTNNQKRSNERKPVEVLEVFISSDMFYVEVVVEGNGFVCDVKVAHHGDPVSCPELCRVLQRNDFVGFASHLEGLIAIYQLNCDKSRKQKAYVALQALENDLSTLADLQKFVSEPRQLVYKSPVGVLVQRKGGFPMHLTFFITPYDLLEVKEGIQIPFTVENIFSKNLGESVSITIDNSVSHKLQTGTLINNIDGKSMPVFGALTQLNSVTLPACFCMKLSKPLPLAMDCIKKIQSVTSIDIPLQGSPSSLMTLITNRQHGPYHVRLPDQCHTYHMDGGDRKGALVTSIPFTHPTHVPQVLVFLRQQCLFNALISSCVRDNVKVEGSDSIVFEVGASSLSSLCVSFEHPLDNESLVSMELNLTDIVNLRCKTYFSTGSEADLFYSEEVASRVLQKSFSIPVLMRSVIKKAQSMQKPICEMQQANRVAVTSVSSNSSFLPNPSSGTSNKSDNAGFASDNSQLPMQQDLFDLENLGHQGLSLNMLADDCSSLSSNFYQPHPPAPLLQNTITPPGGHNQSSMQQRKRTREENDFLDRTSFSVNSNQGLSLSAQAQAMGMTDNGTTMSHSKPPPGDPPQKRSRHDDPSAVDPKNLQAGGDLNESPPVKKDKNLGSKTTSDNDKRNSSSSRDKEKRKDKSWSTTSSKSSSGKSSSTKEKDHRNSSSSKITSSNKDREKTSSTKSSSSSSGLSAIVDKLHQNVKTDSASPNKYSTSSEGQFTVKSSSSSQGIKLTINKTSRTSDSGSSKSKSSSSTSSSKHNRDSPKPRSCSSSPSHKKSSSPSWKASPKHMMPPPQPGELSGNGPIDLVEQRLKALHADNDSPGSCAPQLSPFEAIHSKSPMGPPSASSSMSRPSPVIIDDELMDEALCALGQKGM